MTTWTTIEHCQKQSMHCNTGGGGEGAGGGGGEGASWLGGGGLALPESLLQKSKI